MKAPCFVIVLVLMSGCFVKGDNLLPKVDSISKIIMHFKPEESPVEVFEVPQKHWNHILQSLAPARVDPNPAKWQGYGTMEITHPTRR